MCAVARFLGRTFDSGIKMLKPDNPESDPMTNPGSDATSPLPDGSRRNVALSSTRWSMLAVVGRQIPQMLAALILARILGPETYGIISAATVYVTLTTLALDQGLAAALVQRPILTPRLPGAIASANLLSGLLLAGLTIAASGTIADFFRAPGLEPLLWVLGGGLIIKSMAITPRAMLQRQLDFRSIGIADVAGGALSCLAAIIAVWSGAGVWSMAWQVLTLDIIITVILLWRAPRYRPNLSLRELKPVLPFSLRIFGSNALAYLSRNLDNILVGRYLGVASLSLYSMSYRVLVVPVQMIGQTVNRVVFPLFSRMANQPERLGSGLLSTTELLSFAAIPSMLGVAVASSELVDLALGSQWKAATPILAVLCIAGARETVFYITQPLMRSMGAGKLIFRYEWLATFAQLGGIVIGLQFGVLGVALGVMTSGFVLTPALLLIQRHLTGVRIREQLGRILPPLHASLWAVAAYYGITLFGWGSGLTLVIGMVAYLATVSIVLTLFHRPAARRTLTTVRDLFAPRK